MSKRGGRGGRGAISYIKQDEPAFLKRFKQKAGYVEGPDVNTKREQLPERDEDEPEHDDEKPQVVVLHKGDLTAEEAEALGGVKSPDDEDEEPPADGRVVFKKPKKRSSDSEVKSASSASKKKKDKHGDSGNPKKNKVKAIKNTKLLSFGDEEEEEEG